MKKRSLLGLTLALVLLLATATAAYADGLPIWIDGAYRTTMSRTYAGF